MSNVELWKFYRSAPAMFVRQWLLFDWVDPMVQYVGEDRYGDFDMALVALAECIAERYRT